MTLPGAFVGVLLGSGDPMHAAAAQVLVLVGLLAAEGVAVVTTVELVARGHIRRAATAGRPASAVAATAHGAHPDLYRRVNQVRHPSPAAMQ